MIGSERVREWWFYAVSATEAILTANTMTGKIMNYVIHVCTILGHIGLDDSPTRPIVCLYRAYIKSDVKHELSLFADVFKLFTDWRSIKGHKILRTT